VVEQPNGEENGNLPGVSAEPADVSPEPAEAPAEPESE